MHFRILGPFEVEHDGRSLPLGGRQQRTLLAVLLCRANEVVPVEEIIEELWASTPPPSAMKSVHVLVSKLRRTLEGEPSEEAEASANGILLTRPHGYVLSVAPGELDLDLFQALLNEGRRALAAGRADEAGVTIREALALWRGPPLAEFAYDSFAQVEIARLETLRVAAIEDRLEADLALGRHADLLPEIEALVAKHPLRERLRGQLMLALYRSGRQAEALQAYQNVRRMLGDELGLEPGPTLRQLEREILAQDPSLDASAPPKASASDKRGKKSRSHLKAAALGLAGIIAAGALGVTFVGFSRDSSRPSLAGYGNAVGIIDSRTHRVIEAVPVGNTPSSIALSADAAWTLNADDRTISRIDRKTRKLVTTFGTGSTPTDVAVGYGSLWVGDSSSSIARFDLETGRRTTTIRLPKGPPSGGRAGESRIAIAAGSAWAINPDASVSRIDAQTNEIVATIPGIAASAIAAGREGIWLIDQSRSAVARIGARSNRVAQSIHLNAGSLNDLAVGAGAVWVTDPFGGLLWRVDPGPPALTKTIDVGPGGAVVDASTDSVWVVNHLDDKLLEIDPRTNQITVIKVGAPQNVAAAAREGWAVKALPAASCGPLLYSGGGRPDLVIVSDLPLQGISHVATEAMAAAVAFVLKQRHFTAGNHTVGYRSCDDSTPQAGGFDFEKCGTNAKAYAANPEIVGVIGAYDSFCSGIEIRVTSRAPGPLPMISPATTYLGLTRAGPGTRPGELRFRYPTGDRNYVRVIAADHLQATADAQLAKQLRLKRVFILDDNQNSGLDEYFRRAATKLRLGLAGSTSWDPHAANYRRLARRIERSDADGVFLGGYQFSNGARLIRDLRAALGPDVALIAPDGFIPLPELIRAAGSSANGLYISLAGVPDPALGPAGTRFLEAFTQSYRRATPWYTATYAAAAAELLLDAIARSDGTRASLNRQLRATYDPRGILGPIRFDENGDLTSGAVTIFRIGPANGRPTPSYPWLQGAYVDRVLRARGSLVEG